VWPQRKTALAPPPRPARNNSASSKSVIIDSPSS
jgi:hypothetical protein